MIGCPPQTLSVSNVKEFLLVIDTISLTTRSSRMDAGELL